MENYEPKMSFGEGFFELYEDMERGDEEAAVAFLEGQARGGPALELGLLYVDEPFQGRGVGAALMAASISPRARATWW